MTPASNLSASEIIEIRDAMLPSQGDSFNTIAFARAIEAKILAADRASQASAQPPAFQDRVQPWMMACFGPEISSDIVERNHRFLEESLELVQATGCTADEAHQLVDYVYGRPAGEPMQEVGGVMVTLAALCLAQGLDMHAAGETELARIWTKVDVIRAKQAAKPKHSPLPALASTPHSAAPEAQSGYYKPVSVEAYRAASGVSPEPTRVGTLWKARGIDHAVTWFQDADRLIDGAHAIFVRAALAPQVAPGPGSVDPVASGGTFPDAADEENPPLDLRSAVHRLMKEHGSEKRSGPCRFTPGVFAPSGQAFIDDDDFLYDATIRVGGDFVDDKQHSYARAICDVLNAAIAASNGSRGGAHG